MVNLKSISSLISLLFITATLACSITGLRSKVQSTEQTAQAFRTEVGDVVAAGSSLISTAQAIETQHAGILKTAKVISTQVSPIVNTVQAVATNSPGLVQTAQSFFKQEIPSGEPPSDIPIIHREQAESYFGASQYIFYITPTGYADVLDFYKSQMPINGWVSLEYDSHEYDNAAQLVYSKDNRIATINMSLNPLNHTVVIVISIETK